MYINYSHPTSLVGHLSPRFYLTLAGTGLALLRPNCWILRVRLARAFDPLGLTALGTGPVSVNGMRCPCDGTTGWPSLTPHSGGP